MDVLEDIRTYLGDDWKKVTSGIRQYLGTDISLLETTNEKLLENNGKQVRPVIGLLTARACGGRANDDSIKFAIASELLHNATLLHDDVADESDCRRGKPTVRALMGPSISVLVGDFWLVRAVKAILDSENGQNEVVTLYSRTLSDLAEGEMLQLQKAGSVDTTLQDYLNIIYRKTASLFVATTVSAAISVKADKKSVKAAGLFGEYMGIAFQIRDDILDYTSTDSIGKPVGVDIMEKKITLPLLCAFENSGKHGEKEVRDTIRNIDSVSKDEILSFVRNYGGVEGAQKILEDYCGRAISALSALPESEDREFLAKLAVMFSNRTK